MIGLGLDLSLRWRPTSRFSPAARDYFARLDAASLRVTTYDAANARLIDRLVANGGNFWPDSGAFCAMAGYLFPTGGTLIPLKDGHDAGTLNAFVTGDWNAATGLKGDGSTKYVNSNRNNNADGQNDQAMGVYVDTATSDVTSKAYIGAGSAVIGATGILVGLSSMLAFRNRNSTADTSVISFGSTGLLSMSRSSSAAYEIMAGGSQSTVTRASQTPFDSNVGIFVRLATTPSTDYVDARLPFYHIGPSLNGTGELAELDTILTDWQTDLANA